MAGVKIKFRCYQCNQLLGVSRSRVGSAVTCPKCATELIVPDPDEAPAVPPSPQGGPQASSDTTPAFLANLAAGLPIELADINPEDIRVVPEAGWVPPPIDVEVEVSPAAPSAEPPPSVAASAPAPGVGRAPQYDFASAPTPPVWVPPPPDAGPDPLPVPIPGPAAEPIIPPIKVGPPSLAPERMTTLRARDIVLPRSVVASWSLFVLLAQALAFIAGLLTGHFIWRVH